MALKHLLDLNKTDRYTADGRDKINELQAKVTEDVKYKTGDISQKTGLQKQPDGSWAPPKKGGKSAAKKEAGSINRTPDRIAKETAIMEALNLSTGEDNNLHKMSDETIERLYARTQEKPAAGKTTIRQGPNTKTLNETPAEHIQKNLDAYKGNQPGDMEGLVLGPSGYKRQTSARIPSGGQSITYTKEGEEDITLFFDKDGELENADVSAGSKPAAKKRPKAIRWSRENMQTMHENAEYITPQQADNFYHQYGLDKTGEHKDRKGWLIKEYKNDDGDIYRAKYNQENKYIGYDFLPKGSAENPGDESKPAEPKPEIKLGGGADTYYFDDPENMSNEDKVFKALAIELDEPFGDRNGNPDDVESWVEAWKNNIQYEGGLGIKSKKTRQNTTPVSAAEVKEILERNPKRLQKIINNAKNFYSGGTTMGFDVDAAPKIRQLTGDCKIRVRRK